VARKAKSNLLWAIDDPAHRPFLEAILARPDDDAPRLVYGDWLQERGGDEAKRGEIIALQCSGEKFDQRNDAKVKTWLRALNLPGYLWLRRGFLEVWAFVQMEEVVRAAKRAGERAPLVSRVEVSGSIDPDVVARFAAWPGLARVRELEVKAAHPMLGPAGTAALAASPHLAGLEALELKCHDLGNDGARALTAAELPRLRELDVGLNNIATTGAKALASWPSLRGVRRLVLDRNPIRAAGAQALASSPHLGALEELSIPYANLDDEAARALLASKRFKKLTRLDLDENPKIAARTMKAIERRFS
jgi:uncharacterized protein (TIGR02996 family)